MEEVITSTTGMTFTDEPDLVEEGEYEFTISNVEKKKSKDGTTDYLTLYFKIRNDVEQPYKGRVLFLSVFRDKNTPTWYDFSVVRPIIATQAKKMPDGKRWSITFDTPDECVQYLNGLNLRATVVHSEYEDLAGEQHTKATISKGFNAFKPTAVPAVATATTTEGTTTVVTNAGPLTDSDLPF